MSWLARRGSAAPWSGRAICLTVALLTAALYTVVLGLGLISFAQWDNIEAFLPGIWYGHTSLLDGSFPLWNPYQNLGEPLHAFGYAGLLYPPYTLLVAVVRAAGASPVLVLQISAVLHASAAAGAMCWLAHGCGSRPAHAVAAGLTIAGAGYAAVAGTVWVHVWPNLFWQIVALQAVLLLLRRGPSTGRLLLAAGAQAAPFLTGHVQTAAIAVLGVWLWGLLLLWLDATTRRHAPAFILSAIAGPLLAAPAILPTLAALAGSARVSLLTFGDQQVQPDALLGLFAGAIALPAGFMDETSALALFVGAWVPVALLAAALHLPKRTGSRSATLRAATVAATLLVVLSLGSTAGIYLVLRLLPFWADAQGPFKFFAAAVPFLVIAGTLALDRINANRDTRAVRIAAAVGMIVLATALFVAPPVNALGWVLAAGCALQITALAASSRVARIALPVSCALLLPCVLATARPADHTKAYRAEANPGFSADQLAILRTSRVLPLSSASQLTPRVRALATFNAPMLDRYPSATGQRFALSAQILDRVLPAQFDGVPFPDAARRLLVSDWPFAARVGTLIVRHDDVAAHRLIADARPDAQPLFRTAHAVAYGIGPTAADVFVAEPATATDELPPAGELRAATNAATVTVLAGAPPEMRFRVRAATATIAVVSMLMSQELRVELDGSRVEPRPVFGGLTGISIPAGDHIVELRLRRWPVGAGAIAAAATLLLLVALSLVWRNPERAEPTG